MPFMAFQGLWVGHRPALVVLVDERLAIGADLAGEARRFRRCLFGFRRVLLHLTRISRFLRQREQGQRERKREGNQYQLFHTGTPSERTTLGGRPGCVVPAFRSGHEWRGRMWG